MKPKDLFIGALVLHEDQPCIVDHIEKAGLICCHICGTNKDKWVVADSLEPVPLTEDYLKKLGLHRRLLSDSWRGDFQGEYQGKQVLVDKADVFYKVCVQVRGHYKPTQLMTCIFVTSVSELQAIFAMCGIDKEVEA